MYTPTPLDTSKIDLSPELEKLQELLAENVHEHWAIQKFSTGWTYGIEYDVTLKKHPNLVPYSQLSEEDKIYDRNTAMETVKSILALGFTINEKASEEE